MLKDPVKGHTLQKRTDCQVAWISLEILDISYCGNQIDQGLGHLITLKNLHFLCLRYTTVTPENPTLQQLEKKGVVIIL